MIRRTLMIGLFTCLGLVLTAVTWLAHYENRYYEILRLKKESERIPEAERKARAKELAAKVFQKYQTTENLSFKADIVHYWCRDGAWESKLPMDWWPLRRIATVNMTMTRAELRTEVFVEGRQLYAFFLANGRCQEFKWPHNGVAGMHTEFAIDMKSPAHLTSGVSGSLLCALGVYRMSWIGPGVHRAAWFKDTMENGLWIGSTHVQGDRCDVVVTMHAVTDSEETSWHVFYVNTTGFIVMWMTPHFRIEKRPGESDRLIWVDNYADFSFDPIASSVFAPCESLTQESKTWRFVPQREPQ